MQLELPRKLNALIEQAHLVATELFLPISRKYDRAEHEYPVELDMLASLMDGMNDAAGAAHEVGAGRLKREENGTAGMNGTSRVKTGAAMARVPGFDD